MATVFCSLLLPFSMFRQAVLLNVNGIIHFASPSSHRLRILRCSSIEVWKPFGVRSARVLSTGFLPAPHSAFRSCLWRHVTALVSQSKLARRHCWLAALLVLIRHAISCLVLVMRTSQSVQFCGLCVTNSCDRRWGVCVWHDLKRHELCWVYNVFIWLSRLTVWSVSVY